MVLCYINQVINSMKYSWLLIPLLLVVSPLFAEDDVTLEELMKRQKEVKMRKANGEKVIRGKGGTKTVYVEKIREVIVTVQAKESKTFVRKYDTGFDMDQDDNDDWVIKDKVPKGKRIKARLLTEINSNGISIISAVFLDDYKDVKLKGKKVVGSIKAVLDDRIFVQFTTLEIGDEEHGINAVGMEYRDRKNGLVADSVDRKVGEDIIKEVASIGVGLGKNALDMASGGVAGSIFEKTTLDDDIEKEVGKIDNKTVYKVNKGKKIYIYMLDDLVIERII
jgi:hypothetical protein